MAAGSTLFSGVTYSTNPVYQKKSKSGFYHNFYIMYHATDPDNVESILKDGFRLSTGPGQMLGDGIYCSLDIQKAQNYGSTVFRLLVYPGKTYECSTHDDPKRVGGSARDPSVRWQADYAAAWVPPGSYKFNSKGLEENCVRSRSQISILGIAKGWANLSSQAQALTINTEGTNTQTLSHRENIVLKRMRCEVGESWTLLQVAGSRDLVMDVSRKNGNVILWSKGGKGAKDRKDNQLFKVWHDNTIRCKLDPSKKLCIKDTKTLYLGKDDTKDENQFQLCVFDANIIRNNNNSLAPSLHITVTDLKKGSSVVALENKLTSWLFIM